MKQGGTVEAYVLAGGKSSRMGTEKGLALLNGKPMVIYVLEVLNDLGLETRIVTRDSRYSLFGKPLLADRVEGKGPLGGLQAALNHCSADFVLLLSCDMPMVSVKVMELLLSGRSKGEVRLASQGPRIHPFPGLYPSSLMELVEKQLARNELKMRDFILKTHHSLVPSIGLKFPGNLKNINTLKELEEMETKMRTMTVKTFGILAEKLKGEQLEIPFEKDTESLILQLTHRYPILKNLNFSLAVDQKLIHENTTLKGDEEIAVLPPFSGG